MVVVMVAMVVVVVVMVNGVGNGGVGNSTATTHADFGIAICFPKGLPRSTLMFVAGGATR